jgi:hypothetical protein
MRGEALCGRAEGSKLEQVADVKATVPFSVRTGGAGLDHTAGRGCPWMRLEGKTPRYSLPEGLGAQGRPQVHSVVGTD